MPFAIERGKHRSGPSFGKPIANEVLSEVFVCFHDILSIAHLNSVISYVVKQ